MNKIMKIKKGVEKTEEGFKEIPAYISRCQNSLLFMLKEADSVTIKCVGNVAIGNAMKTIARVSKRLEAEGQTLCLDAPVFVMEESEESPIAVFTINVSLK